MRYLKKKLMNKFKLLYKLTIFITTIFFASNIYANDFIINGNKYSDKDAILSIIGQIPDVDDKTKTNYILKQLNNSGLFQKVEINYDKKNYLINVVEFPSINNIFYMDNERFKDEEIDEIIEQLEIFTLSNYNINLLINELKKLYQSFGYNNIEIETKITNLDNNSSDLYLYFNEGKLTKIKKIIVNGNDSYDDSILLSKIKSKTKKITNIFANNNFKMFQINNDLLRIKNFYKSEGFKDVNLKFFIEYFPDNRVNVIFNVNEGKKYYFSSITTNYELDKNALIEDEINSYVKNNSFENNHYDKSKIDNLEINISGILEKYGEKFYQITAFEKITNNEVDILYEIKKTNKTYINQINISGNTRTFDYVIRRELDISEGDPINYSKIKQIKKDLKRLPFFNNVEINQNPINDEYQDIEINVEETQTGTFNVGLSVGSLDGLSFVSGLKEKNINGTGRSLEFLINTSENNRAFTINTTEKFYLNSKINHQYSTNYKESDFSKSKSYKLNTFGLDTSFNYLLADDIYHTFGVGYTLKDYIVTDSSTVSSNILQSSGESISFNINNQLVLNTTNSYIKPTNGNYISLANYLETPSSSSNGFLKNVLTAKKYIKNNNNIYSVQARAGNIYSLNDNEILSDDKFSLGGRWLRGFDNFGAGPRNSRTAYVGGNNLLVAKFDFSKPITLNEQNPIYINLFNDYGLVWGNKNTVTSSDQSLRSSYGFGLSYYSPIGPIGFSWGFPLVDEDYDIKRMFMFTIGNLN